MKDKEREEYTCQDKNKEFFQYLREIRNESNITDELKYNFTKELGSQLSQLWEDEAIHKVMKRRHEFCLLDSTE